MLGVGWEACTRVWSQASLEPGMDAKRRGIPDTCCFKAQDRAVLLTPSR